MDAQQYEYPVFIMVGLIYRIARTISTGELWYYSPEFYGAVWLLVMLIRQTSQRRPDWESFMARYLFSTAVYLWGMWLFIEEKRSLARTINSYCMLKALMYLIAIWPDASLDRKISVHFSGFVIYVHMLSLMKSNAIRVIIASMITL